MHKKILKRTIESKIKNYAEIFPVVGILGPRQCGKSTLIKNIIKNISNSAYFDLENYEDVNKITTDPLAFFHSNKNKIICLDEIQKLPHIFQTMRGVIDKNRRNGQFFVLGSASPKLIKQASESLAGRIGYIELTPFHILEIQNSDHMFQHWLRGGFPESYLAIDDKNSFLWRESFLKNLIERDIQEFKKIPPIRIFKLLKLLAHYHGQTLNYSKLATSIGVDHNTIESYIDMLEEMYFIRRIVPYFANGKKRLVKLPKLYIRDSGFLHVISCIQNESNLKSHPLYGFSFEGYVIENLITIFDDCEASYFRSSNKEEIDLILERDGKKIAIEIKTSTRPTITKEGQSAIKFIKPDHILIIVPYYENTYRSKQEYGDLTICSLFQAVKEIKKIFDA